MKQKERTLRDIARDAAKKYGIPYFDSIESYMKHIGREDQTSEIEKIVTLFANTKQKGATTYGLSIK